MNGPYKIRLRLAVLIFGAGGLFGPFLHFLGAGDDLVSPLWPAWILGVSEYAIGREAAYATAIVSNVLLFLIVGLIAAVPVRRSAYIATVSLCLIGTLSLGQWHYGTRIESYLLLAAYLIIMFSIYRFTEERIGSRLERQ